MEYKFEYGDLEEREIIFNENKELVFVGESNIEMGNFITFVDQETFNKMRESQELEYKTLSISEYLSENPTSIEDIENYILETELNKIMEGMN